MNKKVLITGVAGFIGSNLAEAMIERNWSVTGIDNLSHGTKENMVQIADSKLFKFIKGDVKDKKLIMELAGNVDIIVHLAALKIPRYGGALDTLLVNVDGTRSVLNATIQTDCKLFIASTSDVYGKNTELPFKEDSSSVIGSPKVGRWSYAVSKMFDEQLFFAYCEKYKISGAIFRFFGSYGPNQHLSWWGGPQSVFINAILSNKELEIHGDGSQTRSFCYISDTVQGILGAIESEKANKEIINIGNDREITIKNLAEIIWSLADKKGEPSLKFIPYSSFERQYEDVKRRIPDLSLAKKLFGYTPRVDLEEGLLKTIHWQKRRMGL